MWIPSSMLLFLRWFLPSWKPSFWCSWWYIFSYKISVLHWFQLLRYQYPLSVRSSSSISLGILSICLLCLLWYWLLVLWWTTRLSSSRPSIPRWNIREKKPNLQRSRLWTRLQEPLSLLPWSWQQYLYLLPLLRGQQGYSISNSGLLWLLRSLFRLSMRLLSVRYSVHSSSNPTEIKNIRISHGWVSSSISSI